MLSSLIVNTFIVFSITLILTKSKVLAHKRKFVIERYKSSKINDKPSWIHIWFHAMWTCPMCSGFWIGLFVALIYPLQGLIQDTLFCFGLNWLLHCIEDSLFSCSEHFCQKKEKNS